MKGVIMIRHRLQDKEWKLIATAFEPPKRMGRPGSEPRKIMDGILWILRTGASWRDLPPAFGPWQTVWHLFNQWNQNGTLNKVLNRLQLTQELDKELWCIDGTIIRAARCAGGGGKKTTRRSLATTH